MKKFFLEVAKMVTGCALLLVFSSILNWTISLDRIREYQELSSKMDAMAEYLQVEFVKSNAGNENETR